MARKWDLGEIVAVAGAIVGVVGHAVWLFKQKETSAADGIKLLGFAVFVAGIVLTLREISKRLGELRSIQNFTATAIALSEASRLSRREPKSVYLNATTEVLTYLVSDYVPRITAKLQEFASNPRVTIEVSDHSPIFDLLYRLGSTLPPGSIWVGITLLENPYAWALPADTRFGSFKNIMRKRAKSGELAVGRIYYFQDDASKELMHAELAQEAANSLAVRVISGGKAPPDISLLYAPKGRRTTRAPKLDMDDPITALRSKGYQRLCALSYDAQAGTLLTRLSLFPGDTPEFGALENALTEQWKRSTPLVSDTPIAPGTGAS